MAEVAKFIGLVASVLFLAACSAGAGVGPSLDGGLGDASPADLGRPIDAGGYDLARPDLGPPPDLGTPCTGAPYPILLHHGFFGFDSIGPLNYYYQVAADLRARGETVVEASIDPIQSSEVRGAELAALIDSTLETTGACKVNVIAHSQGGLDVRYVIGSLGYGDRIASVVTVATPHRGTRVADAVLGLVPGGSQALLDFFAHIVGRVLYSPMEDSDLMASLRSLSQANVSAFDAANPDDPRVAFYSIAGRSNLDHDDAECGTALWPNPTGNDPIDALLSPTGAFLRGNVFDPTVNDGLVTVASAKWGTFLACIPADHFDEVGQIADRGADPISGFDHLDFYERVVTFLHGRAF